MVYGGGIDPICPRERVPAPRDRSTLEKRPAVAVRLCHRCARWHRSDGPDACGNSDVGPVGSHGHRRETLFDDEALGDLGARAVELLCAMGRSAQNGKSGIADQGQQAIVPVRILAQVFHVGMQAFHKRIFARVTHDHWPWMVPGPRDRSGAHVPRLPVCASVP